MAILKKIKFGTGTATPIAKTVVQGKPEGVISVTNTSGFDNTDSEEKDYSYDIDVNVDNATIVKSSGSLAVGTVPAAQVSVADSDGVFTAENVETALKELKDDIADVISDGKTYSIVDDTANVQDLPTNVLKRYRLQETVGLTDTLVGDPIDILKDNSLLAAKLSTTDATWNGSAIVDGTGAEALVLVYKDANGTAQVIAIDVSAFLKESEFGDGLAVSNTGVVSAKLGNGLEFCSESGENKSINVKIDSTSESFLTVGAGGVKLAGVQDAIDAKVAALDFTTDAAVAGQYVAAIEETDGVVAVKTRANVSEAVLNNYAKGSDATAVAATDTINQAISKLENQIAEASAEHSIVEAASGNQHVTVTPTTAASGQITYTIGETNIADADDLAAEITRAQAAEGEIAGLVGLGGTEGARAFTPTTNYGGSSTSVMGNMQALDTQIKTNADAIAALQTQVGAIEYEVNGTELILYGIPQHQAQQGG